MPKGKKCEICNEGRMRRFYTRSYWTGYKFTEEHPEGIDNYPKGRFKPQGWKCDKCHHIELDDQYDNEKLKQKAEKLERKRREYKWLYNKHKHEFIYTKKEMKQEKKFLKRYYNILYGRRAINWYSAKGTHSFLRGLKEGGKISDKHWEEKLEREKLTDDQILEKAELIKTKRKLGYA